MTPTLLLEDIEHHVSAVSCWDDGVHLRFQSPEAFAHAHREFAGVESFLLITSHEGCNEDGGRDPHL